MDKVPHVPSPSLHECLVEFEHDEASLNQRVPHRSSSARRDLPHLSRDSGVASSLETEGVKKHCTKDGPVVAVHWILNEGELNMINTFLFSRLLSR